MSKVKKLLSDTIIYGAFTIIQRFLTFLLTPFYTNYLSAEDLGNVVLIFTILSIFNIFNNLGLENSFYRFYNEKDKKLVFSNSFMMIFIVSIILSAIIYFLAIPISESISNSSNFYLMVQFSALILFFDSLILIPFCQIRMERKALKFSIYKFLIIFFAVALNYYFIGIERKTGEYVFIAQAIASFLGLIILAPIIFKNLIFKFDKSILIEFMYFGIPTIPAAAAVLSLKSADHIIIPILKDAKELAIYSTNYKLALPMMMFVTTFEYAWKPFYLSHYNEENAKSFFVKIFNHYLFFALFILLMINFFIGEIVKIPFLGGKFINPDYWEGLSIIPYILGGYLFLGIFNFFSMGIHISKKTKYLPLAVLIGLIFNIICNFIFIPIYGYYAAAVITLLSYFISAVILFYFSQHAYYLNYDFKNNILSLLIAIVLLLLGNYFDNLYFNVFLLISFLFIGYIFKFIEIAKIKSIFK